MNTQSTKTPKQAVVFGASGGIGAALVEGLSNRSDIDCVHAIARAETRCSGKCIAHICDITKDEDLARIATELTAYGAPSIVLIATGLLSNDCGLQPEKSFRHQNLDAFEQVFRINTFVPALIAKHVLPIMPRKERAVFAALSARVGSISDNRLGGWHAYRASKAALNMLIRNYAIEQAARNPQFISVSLHPGTVVTELSAPFRSKVPTEKLFTPEQSANYLLDVIDGLTPADSGKVFDWAGKEIPA